MTVIDAGGLVGRVVAVTATHARVEVATSPHARYAVCVVPGGLPGRLRGAGDGRLVLELDDLHTPLPTGASVVTRSFEGSAVPDGLPMGPVQRTVADGRARTVLPQVRTAALDLVQVIVDAPEQPSTSLEARRRRVRTRCPHRHARGSGDRATGGPIVTLSAVAAVALGVGRSAGAIAGFGAGVVLDLLAGPTSPGGVHAPRRARGGDLRRRRSVTRGRARGPTRSPSALRPWAWAPRSR